MLSSPLMVAQGRQLHATQRYLNIPIGRQTKLRIFTINESDGIKRTVPLQLAEDTVDYWIYLDIGEFKGKTITISGPATKPALNRIYQAANIRDNATMYREANRPQFHFTVKRGWSNDVNGPIFYNGQYHLFWQAFPFGVRWDTGFMYWGHATSRDLIHWTELSPALRLDRLGSPWSGSSLIDHHNDAGFGKDALVLVYTAYDRETKKQVQCLAYSTDNGVTFTRFKGNPILDTNAEVGSKDTRDPHVFWYAPTQHWVMVLFEKDGLSIFNSSDLKHWTRKSHLKGLSECPDLFELPVDGDAHHTKWVIHGGSSAYFIGSFDGMTFTPESAELHYAEGKNAKGQDLLYAAQSFAEMPDGRRIQMAWGRIWEQDMPFTKMMLFPTEFRLVTTTDGLRMVARPIREINLLHTKRHTWSALTSSYIDAKLQSIAPGPLDIKMDVTVPPDGALTLRYQGTDLITLQSPDFPQGHGSVQLLIDKAVAEIFVDDGRRYIVRELPASDSRTGFGCQLEAGTTLNSLDIYELKSMWRGGASSAPHQARTAKSSGRSRANSMH
ncbi:MULTISPECIES: glycoside hydrolase family 32 protein [Acidobacteriaceae]|uniref:glycoside hydrolase family 32 protein n=1 Tax=Acidobacteriaceae TaxID=204434 RepID=UPI001C206DED|nr:MULTISPECIES: glycoside hydrolase family 32 protein [Acidobacteriaceae]MDW5267444.1 glycoside hydrolase family 32 protein [Edaphobacter sp.]